MMKELNQVETMYEVDMEKDIYSLGFSAFLHTHSPTKLNRIVLKCFWTAII